jgi:hypothetical protein
MQKILRLPRVSILILSLGFTSISHGQYPADIEPNCATCLDYGMGLVCEVENLRGLADIVVQSLGNVRSPFQVDQYISCQLAARGEEQAPQWLLDYNDQYRLYIKSAAATFGVPPQLLQCAFLKESVYNSDVKNSGSGAEGLCQIMPDTRNYIDQVLSSAADRRASGKIYDAIEEMEMDQVQSGDEAYYKTILKQDDLYQLWNQNFINLDQQGLYPYRSEGQLDLPTGFSSIGVKRPQNCIAGAALYFRDITSKLSVKIETTSGDEILSGQSAKGDENATLNLMLIMGAAYNAGPGTINNLLKKDGSSMTLQEMVETLEASGNKEMTDYMKSLRSCLTPGGFAPPERWYREDGRAPPLCEGYKQEESELGLLPVRYWP